jgi:hypothetical protein
MLDINIDSLLNRSIVKTLDAPPATEPDYRELVPLPETNGPQVFVGGRSQVGF